MNQQDLQDQKKVVNPQISTSQQLSASDTRAEIWSTPKSGQETSLVVGSDSQLEKSNVSGGAYLKQHFDVLDHLVAGSSKLYCRWLTWFLPGSKIQNVVATNGYRKKKSGHEAGVPRLETVETLTVENDGRKEGLELKIHKNYSKSAILINPQDSATEKLNTSGSRNGAFRQEERKSKITVYVVIILLTYSVRFFLI